MKSFLLVIFSLLMVSPLATKQPLLNEKGRQSPPPRIIRTCCSFGSEMKLMGIPGLKITEVIGLSDLGKHKYLGDKKKREGNGIIYTKNGGFIDLGHLRDQADWTAYLYNLIKSKKDKNNFIQVLGHEGGLKTLSLKVPKDISEADMRQLAGKIAYDISVWHEIATWYGVSSIPFVPERFSSFSVEDAYSNLLGVTLGMMAIESELPYEEAMTDLILQAVDYLDAVPSMEESIQAMEAVREVWWTREKKLPNKNILIKRQLAVYPTVSPLLIEETNPDKEEVIEAYKLSIPELSEKGDLLADFYSLNIKLNPKVPFRKLFPNRKRRQVSQEDFPYLISEIEKEIFLGKQKQILVSKRKLEKEEKKKMKMASKAKKLQKKL